LYSPNIRAIRAKSIKWAKHVAHIGGICKVMIRKYDEMTPLGRPRGRWKDNI
jgi:hypothetical protein